MAELKGEMFELTNCDIARETDAAILVKTNEHPDGIWIPHSQVEKIEHSDQKRATKVRMTAWIAKKKGLR